MKWVKVLLLGCSLLLATSAYTADRPPNFIIILLDDMGLHDAGFAGNDFIETPAMDQLAREGTVFTHAYSNAPNCAPSRAAIMSGQYAPRTGLYTMMTGDMGDAQQRRVLTPKNLMYLPENVYTLAEMLHDHGYITAQIGKWNIGAGAVRGPLGQGFDINIGGSRVGSLHKGYWAPYQEDLPGLEHAPAGEYMTERLSAEAVNFVNSNSKKPFFLYLSHFAPHFPIQAPEAVLKKYIHKYKSGCVDKKILHACSKSEVYPEYAAMLDVVDVGIMQLRTALREQHVDDNTVIVLLSDNGGYALMETPGMLRGEKSVLYEGGIRVPMVWYVPQAKQAPTVNIPVMGADIYPTFAALAGIDVSKQLLDGVNIAPLMRATGKISTRSLFWYLPGYTYNGDSMDAASSDTNKGSMSGFSQLPAAVIQRDGWKLIRYYDGSPAELYNLAADEQEKRNLLSSEKSRAAAMTQELEDWLAASGGVTKLPANPEYLNKKH